jgi:hypothetical protein
MKPPVGKAFVGPACKNCINPQPEAVRRHRLQPPGAAAGPAPDGRQNKICRNVSERAQFLIAATNAAFRVNICY